MRLWKMVKHSYKPFMQLQEAVGMPDLSVLGPKTGEQLPVF